MFWNRNEPSHMDVIVNVNLLLKRIEEVVEAWEADPTTSQNMLAIQQAACSMAQSAANYMTAREHMERQTLALEALARQVDAMDKTLMQVMSAVYREKLRAHAHNRDLQVGERPDLESAEIPPVGTATSSRVSDAPMPDMEEGFVDPPGPNSGAATSPSSGLT